MISPEKEREICLEAVIIGLVPRLSLPSLGLLDVYLFEPKESRQQKHEKEKRNQEVKEREKRFSITRMVCAWRLHPNTRNQATARKRREKSYRETMRC